MLPPMGMGFAGQSAIQEWQALAEQIRASGQNLVDATEGRASRIYDNNKLGELIDSTAPGAMVGNSTLTREQADQLRILVGAFRAFINTPIKEAGGLTPLQLLYTR